MNPDHQSVLEEAIVKREAELSNANGIIDK